MRNNIQRFVQIRFLEQMCIRINSSECTEQTINFKYKFEQKTKNCSRVIIGANPVSFIDKFKGCTTYIKISEEVSFFINMYN